MGNRTKRDAEATPVYLMKIGGGTFWSWKRCNRYIRDTGDYKKFIRYVCRNVRDGKSKTTVASPAMLDVVEIGDYYQYEDECDGHKTLIISHPEYLGCHATELEQFRKDIETELETFRKGDIQNHETRGVRKKLQYLVKLTSLVRGATITVFDPRRDGLRRRCLTRELPEAPELRVRCLLVLV